METFIFIGAFLAWLISWLNSQGVLPFSPKYSESGRLLLHSLVCMCLIPVFVLFCSDYTEASINMTVFLSFGFLVFSHLSEEKMYEEVVPGYKEGKERKKEMRRVLRQQRKRKPLSNAS